jgi:hypothetical protein
MDRQQLEEIADRLQRGDISREAFLNLFEQQRTADLGIAQVDLDRLRRCGFPEVVYGQGKSPDAVADILETLVSRGIDAFATRISPEQADLLGARFAAGLYNPVARTFRVPSFADENAGEHDRGRIAIVTAGTSDLPVAEEARETALWMGVAVSTVHDVGVAGPHRLPEQLHKIDGADAVVVIAGMEGALPSVVGGYVRCPVIAVPTSVGYGASFAGISALLGMLNSCASNVTVVNIDAGFKGAYVAGLIARNVAAARRVAPLRE